MSDEQPTSWRDRFFGSTPTTDPAPATDERTADEPERTHDSAEVAPDQADVAATSVTEHDQHQPLVEHEPAETADDRAGDSPIEPTVIAPSTLRGPSHSAAHPDDSARATADQVHGAAAESSLTNPGPDDALDAPPPLVEPRRPSFGLRRRAGDDATDAAADAADADADAAAASASTEREFVEPEPTQAMETQRADDQPTRALDTTATDAAADTGAQTRVLDTSAAPTDAELRTERFGIIRDEVPASSIPVDAETARAAAGGGTPIVLVEEPMPPRRKGARAVGFAVALLATLIFALVFAAGYFAVGYLFDRGFDAQQTLETVWLRPSYLLPVVVFFLAYWLITLLVNRAGWWAHVLGAFIVALLVYAAHIAGAFMEERGGWAAYTAVPGIDPQSLGQLLLAPLSVIAFVIAREVPVWVGGIVARRGRKARDWNRQAMDDFNAENAERLAAYERARG